MPQTFKVINHLGVTIGYIANAKDEGDAQHMAHKSFPDYFDVREDNTYSFPSMFSCCSFGTTKIEQFAVKQFDLTNSSNTELYDKIADKAKLNTSCGEDYNFAITQAFIAGATSNEARDYWIDKLKLITVGDIPD